MSNMQKLPWHLAYALLRQSAAGTSHLHDKRIGHRDIRSANILVFSVDPVVVKIADFGFSCVLDTGPDGQPKSYARNNLKMPISMCVFDYYRMMLNVAVVLPVVHAQYQ